MLYANFILDGGSKGVIDRIKVQQNNAVRAVLNAEYKTPCVKLYLVMAMQFLNRITFIHNIINRYAQVVN